MYRFDEVVFELPADSTITTKQIEDDFEKYWEYGKTDQAGKDEDMKDDEPDPESGGMTRAEMTVEIQKLQEKNEMLESCLLEVVDMMCGVTEKLADIVRKQAVLIEQERIAGAVFPADLSEERKQAEDDLDRIEMKLRRI